MEVVKTKQNQISKHSHLQYDTNMCLYWIIKPLCIKWKIKSIKCIKTSCDSWGVGMEIKPENRRKGGVGFLSMLSLLFNFILFKIQLHESLRIENGLVTIKLLGWVIRNEK